MDTVGHYFRSSTGYNIELSINPEQEMTDCSFTQYCQNVDFNNDGCINKEDVNSDRFLDETDADNDGVINEIDSDIFRNCLYSNYGCENEIPCVLDFNLQLGYSYYANLFVHEFGHQFGKLKDEYIEEGKNGENGRNCYAGKEKTQEECLDNTPWKEMIGKGCGQENSVDCKLEENYPIEINCVEGCDYEEKGIFRSAFNTIMRCHTCNPYSFGLWNEKLIQDELNKFDGK